MNITNSSGLIIISRNRRLTLNSTGISQSWQNLHSFRVPIGWNGSRPLIAQIYSDRSRWSIPFNTKFVSICWSSWWIPWWRCNQRWKGSSFCWNEGSEKELLLDPLQWMTLIDSSYKSGFYCRAEGNQKTSITRTAKERSCNLYGKMESPIARLHLPAEGASRQRLWWRGRSSASIGTSETKSSKGQATRQRSSGGWGWRRMMLVVVVEDLRLGLKKDRMGNLTLQSKSLQTPKREISIRLLFRECPAPLFKNFPLFTKKNADFSSVTFSFFESFWKFCNRIFENSPFWRWTKS